MIRKCPKCGLECEGYDLGDHPGYLDFACECGHLWCANVIGDMIDDVMARREHDHD